MNIQDLWNVYAAEHCGNNMMSNKIKREAFFAGAEAWRDQMQYEEALGRHFDERQGTLEIVGGTDNANNED